MHKRELRLTFLHAERERKREKKNLEMFLILLTKKEESLRKLFYIITYNIAPFPTDNKYLKLLTQYI